MAEDLSKIEDFSECITPVEGVRTGIFWDVEDYPFPGGPSPDLIYQKIESALNDWGCMGKISIWAYVDEKKGSRWCEFLGKKTKTWKSRIYFLAGGDKPARRDRMLHDILLWRMDNRMDSPFEGNLIVVSDKVRDDKVFFKILGYIRVRYYNVLLVQSNEYAPPESPEWPGLLLDQVYAFGSRSDSESEEPSLKKNRPDQG